MVIVRIQTIRTCSCRECVERRAAKKPGMNRGVMLATIAKRPLPRHDGGIFFVIESQHPVDPAAKVTQSANNITWTFPTWDPTQFTESHLQPVLR